MALDPGLDALLQAMVRYNMMGLSKATPEQARTGFRAVTWDVRPPDLVIPVASVEDGELPGPAGPLRHRVYRPEQEGEGALPTILFLHGGGFVIGDLDTHDNQARRLCREVGAVVVSAEYRLAPENPFPAAVDDAWAALQWVADQVGAGAFGGDPARLVMAGDSAGATLSAVSARRARDAAREGQPAPALAAQLLLYPATDFAAGPDVYPSRIENAKDLLLTAEDMIWFAEQYVGAREVDGRLVAGPTDLADPDLSPMGAADLSDLPHAIVVTAEFDPLRDEGEAYAAALAAAGTPVTAARMDGMIHGYFDLGPVSPGVEDATLRACALLREVLGG